MTIDLQGKNVLVTGASRGIGAAIARQVGAAGARVAVHYSGSEDAAHRTVQEAGNGSKAFQADLRDPVACQHLFAEVVQQFGHIDALVNNAGICPLAPLQDEQWTEKCDEVFAVNLRAVAILCREAVVHFRKCGGGRIVNIASRAAFRGDTEDYLCYAASKGGVVSLSKSIARDFGKDDIKCFIIAPGWVKTDMAKEALEQYGEAALLEGVALNRLTEPTDISPMVTFLLSGLADHATGATIDINAASYVH
ncbi:MAG TPA: 3-oxoacyl-ACP reductase [Candidatus Peribacter riflensis]|uniref:3-oxoacyl-ACP reductase n=1 Tax=Candidatus Peribacter riflensis TaxID=1735162 RepID=A0A0S1STR2_9BACT|nr:MAG: 3-oxoacyl-ACP reductase [Candidatus Peribacter riflensis]OGJ78953.1 MAG: 3-oxoacyl-ACP reductase [Candidatus Peribacteria bacterium RIFOXYB1_FULL_57_12]ALM11093.1 MAG: 3-oxoacyl-ACP reductase [Candidatus Peribacter riflensis]ALM12196.1 MAG: 3-oxoacyl-ACP reductase [Candidatus Peribacter riflensis]ALM13299.1 MAG: 3-oxoacyl-ACP reductase [Candidatus Peribacter riflensis]